MAVAVAKKTHRQHRCKFAFSRILSFRYEFQGANRQLHPAVGLIQRCPLGRKRQSATDILCRATTPLRYRRVLFVEVLVQ